MRSGGSQERRRAREAAARMSRGLSEAFEVFDGWSEPGVKPATGGRPRRDRASAAVYDWASDRNRRRAA